MSLFITFIRDLRATDVLSAALYVYRIQNTAYSCFTRWRYSGSSSMIAGTNKHLPNFWSFGCGYQAVHDPRVQRRSEIQQ